MIFAGYPGIGKTTLASKNKDFIDLESSLFSQYGTNWENVYVRVATSLSDQGYNVFISTHAEVLSLIDHSKLMLIYPNKLLKDKWIHKLLDRALETEKDKDKRAFERAFEHYENDITTLDAHARISAGLCIIDNMDYDLGDIIDEL